MPGRCQCPRGGSIGPGNGPCAADECVREQRAVRQIISQLYPFILGRAASVTGRWAPLCCRDPMCRPDPLSDYNNPPQADFLQHGSAARGPLGSVVLTRDQCAAFTGFTAAAEQTRTFHDWSSLKIKTYLILNTIKSFIFYV